MARSSSWCDQWQPGGPRNIFVKSRLSRFPFRFPFEAKWDSEYPPISKVWRSHWERITPKFEFAPVRRILYTTNAVESLHRSLRKATKTRGSLPNEDAARKLLYLVIGTVTKKWRFATGWRAARNDFRTLWPERWHDWRRNDRHGLCGASIQFHRKRH